MARGKTKLMLRVEQEQGGRKLENLLPRLINQRGLTGAAAYLGVSNATIGYWQLKFGIRIERVALKPGQRVHIKDN